MPATTATPATPAPTPLPKNIPTVEDTPALPSAAEVPADSEYKGTYKGKDGEKYALAVREDEPSEKTHFLKNSRHFWNGTLAEFKDQFEKD